MNILYIFIIGIIIALLAPDLYAGKVTVVNENKRAVWFRIIPDNHHGRPEYNRKVPRKSKKEFEITSQDIDGKALYSIEGKRKYGGGDSCENLSIDKNYMVTFKRHKAGTPCKAIEIPLDAVQSPLQNQKKAA